jgi:hypothetical protein
MIELTQTQVIGISFILGVALLGTTARLYYKHLKKKENKLS